MFGILMAHVLSRAALCDAQSSKDARFLFSFPLNVNREIDVKRETE